MFRCSLPLLAVLTLSASPGAQVPRDSVRVNTNKNSNGGQVGVAAGGGRSAIVWNDATTEEVFVVTSDGRGLTWSPQVRVDNDAFTKKTQTDSVFVSGDNVYVVWESNFALFFSRSTDAGATFSPATPLDVGPGTVDEYRAAYSRDPAGDHVYVASSTNVLDEDLYLTASHDGGATFSAAVLVPSVGTTGAVDELAVAADGNTVHLVWDDNRTGRDTPYYQRSSDGGATFLPNDVPLGDNPGVEDSQAPIEMAVSGSIVAAMWNEEPTGSGAETIQVNVSLDGGLTFQGPVTVGNYTVGTHDADEGTIAVQATTGNIVVTWEDDRFGLDQAFAATSTDGGVSFFADNKLSVLGAQLPRVAAGSSGVAITWESTGFPRMAEGSLSMDGGLSWSSDFVVSDNDPDSVDFVAIAYDDVYDNFLHAWVSLNDSDFNVYAGGYRPQTLTPNGFVAGPTSVSFDLSLFSGAEPFAGVLATATPGGPHVLPFGDGRATGLTQDAFFDFTFGLVTTSFFAPLGPGGTGSTPVFPASLPASFAASFVAISYDPAGGITFGELTDLSAVTIP